MISYQWDKQDLVRYLYCDLHMRNFKIWFDIWGGMQGILYTIYIRTIKNRVLEFFKIVSENLTTMFKKRKTP